MNTPNEETTKPTWFKLTRATTSNVECRTAKAVLLTVPGTDWKFWLPMSLVREDRTRLTISVAADMNIKLFRNGKGAYNKRDVIASREMSGEVFATFWEEAK
jgi:hypothetical protein